MFALVTARRQSVVLILNSLPRSSVSFAGRHERYRSLEGMAVFIPGKMIDLYRLSTRRIHIDS